MDSYYSVINAKGRRIGRKSRFPILSCRKDERIIYKSRFWGSPMMENRVSTPEVEAVLELVKTSYSSSPGGVYYLYELVVVGSDPEKIRQTIQKMETLK